MIKSIIKLGLLLVVGILVYNFFLGTPDEKAQSQKVFNKGKDVIVSVGDLLKSEKSGKSKTNRQLALIGIKTTIACFLLVNNRLINFAKFYHFMYNVTEPCTDSTGRSYP